MRQAIVLSICIVSTWLRAQFLPAAGPVVGDDLSLAVAYGQLAEHVQEEPIFPDQAIISESRKSPYLAAALSLVVPGLGEYYVGDQIWRGMIFTAVDAGLWYGHYHYLGRGDDSVAAFHAFADANWEPQRYADTLNWMLDQANITSYHINNASDFIQINRAEDTLSLFVQGFPISHRLPSRGSQQYYELISKYLQFAHGWKDHESGGPSPLYLRHADMRANMNHQYEIADYFLFGLILNRVLSAIDAVLLVKDHNSDLRLQGELRTVDGPQGKEFIPTAKMRLRF